MWGNMLAYPECAFMNSVFLSVFLIFLQHVFSLMPFVLHDISIFNVLHDCGFWTVGIPNKKSPHLLSHQILNENLVTSDDDDDDYKK